MRMLRQMEPFAKLPMFGFDSFLGLPSNFLGSERGLWSPGQFASDPRVRLKRELGREAPALKHYECYNEPHYERNTHNESRGAPNGRSIRSPTQNEPPNTHA